MSILKLTFKVQNGFNNFPVLGGCNATIKSKKCGQPIAWGCLIRFYCEACFAFHLRSRRANCAEHHSQNLAFVVQSRAARAKIMGDKKSENLKRRRSAQVSTPSSRPSKRAKTAASAPTLPSTSATQGICNTFPFSAVWDPSKSQFNARLIPLPNGALSLAAQPRSETFVSEIMKNVVGGAQLNASALSSLKT